MTKSADKVEGQKIKRIVELYNLIPNLFWSVLNLVPISIFCYRFINLQTTVVFIVISLFSAILPKSFFNSIQPGKTISFYKKAGVTYINLFTQNGDIINRLIRKKFPDYKVVSGGKKSIRKIVGQTYMFEKFHFVMFLFFFFVTIYAIKSNFLLWAAIISINNIIYNIYPCLLQQYIRLRLQVTAKIQAERLMFIKS